MRKEIFADTLKRNKKLLLLFLVMTVVNLSVFKLYRITTEPFLYAEAIIFVFCIILFTADFLRSMKRAKVIENVKYL